MGKGNELKGSDSPESLKGARFLYRSNLSYITLIYLNLKRHFHTSTIRASLFYTRSWISTFLKHNKTLLFYGLNRLIRLGIIVAMIVEELVVITGSQELKNYIT